jgi:hypothetical protein
VVKALVEAHQRLRREHGALQADAEKKGVRIRTLEGQLLEANQRRQDVAKRIDELIAQIDQLDGQLTSLDH